MRSEQAMPPEPQCPSAKETYQQARGRRSQKTWSPLFQSRSRNKDRQALPPAEKRCEASKPCLRSHNALQQRRRTNRRRADCKRPGARSFNPAAAARIGWLPRLPEAMRSEQAMPPEPQRPPAKEAYQQAQGGLQKTWIPLFQSRSRSKNQRTLPPTKHDAKRASHASGATAPFSKGGAPTGAGLWRAKGPGPIVLYRFRGTEQWGFSRPAGGKSGGAGL